MICAKCGARLLDTDQFCSKCGTRVIKEKRCPDCGAVLREGTKFCHKCGRLIEAGEKAQQVSEETLDIPIEAIERNIVSETEKKIRAEQSAARKKPAAGTQDTRRRENDGQDTLRQPAKSRTSQNSSGQEKARASQGASGQSGSKSSREGAVRRSPEPPKKKKSVPEPPKKKKKPVYREEDWEEEDWEEEDWEDDDWDDDDEEESVDVITIMTAVIGCVLLVVVAVLGYHLYQQYVPKNYDKVQEEEQQEQGDQDDGQEEAELSTDGENAVYTLTIIDNVNVRDNPSTSGTNILKVAKAGETYECYGSAGDGSWYEIRLEDGSTGYVYQDYVTVQ